MVDDSFNTNEQTFPKSIRLLTQREFDDVHASNHFAADATLVLKAIANNTKTTRLGLSIGRKVGNAVVRNRWKRLIRESFRKQKNELPSGLDIVVRPRKGAKCDYSAIDQSLRLLSQKIHRRIQKGAK